MEWITLLNKQTITEQVENLTLRETNLISFNRESFKSRHLPQTFRNYCFTDLS